MQLCRTLCQCIYFRPGTVQHPHVRHQWATHGLTPKPDLHIFTVSPHFCYCYTFDPNTQLRAFNPLFIISLQLDPQQVHQAHSWETNAKPGPQARHEACVEITQAALTTKSSLPAQQLGAAREPESETPSWFDLCWRRMLRAAHRGGSSWNPASTVGKKDLFFFSLLTCIWLLQ